MPFNDTAVSVITKKYILTYPPSPTHTHLQLPCLINSAQFCLSAMQIDEWQRESLASRNTVRRAGPRDTAARNRASSLTAAHFMAAAGRQWRIKLRDSLRPHPMADRNRQRPRYKPGGASGSGRGKRRTEGPRTPLQGGRETSGENSGLGEGQQGTGTRIRGRGWLKMGCD